MRIGIWVVSVLVAAMFAFAGGSKLAGVEAMVQTFEAVGVGQWFRYVTGLIEVVGAVLLLVPSMARFAAAALAVTMVGATATHLVILHNSPAAPLVLLVLLAIIGWFRRNGR